MPQNSLNTNLSISRSLFLKLLLDIVLARRLRHTMSSCRLFCPSLPNVPQLLALLLCRLPPYCAPTISLHEGFHFHEDSTAKSRNLCPTSNENDTRHTHCSDIWGERQQCFVHQ